jgi:serine/threonine-protein kinase
MQDPTSPPLRLGAYEPLLELASGGMATVYIARQLGAAGFERIVVVKRVHRHLLGNRDFYDMFRDEARVASIIKHPNVVPVIDVVEVQQPERELFLVMDYVESSSLATLRKASHEEKSRIPVPILARILYDVLMGLHAAHVAIDMQGRPLGVVHRDVSPQNVIVGIDGSSRLIDFGVAKASHRLTETKSGSVKGKYSYMAPEQARGLDVDRRTDIFAAGIMLHECLTDKRLFRGENELDTVRRIMEQEIVPPSSVQPAIPAALDAVAMKALARPPDQRFQTAVEMAEAIEQAVSLASPREVAAYLEKTCGKRLAERRDALREMLAGTVAPLAVELAADPGDSQPSRSLHVSGVMPLTTEPRRERSKGPMIAVVAIAAAAVGALVIVLANRTQRAPDVTTATSTATTTKTVATASTVATPATTTTAAPAATDVTVVLEADAPIESVHVVGSKKIELAGTTARVALDPWSAPLKIDATLEGGKKVTATLEPGTTSARLAAPKRNTTTTVGTTATVNTNKPDLQGNPYGVP